MPPKRSPKRSPCKKGAGVLSSIRKIERAVVPLAKLAGKKAVKEYILPAALKKAGLSGEGMKKKKKKKNS